MIYLSRSPRNSQGFEESTPSNKTTGEILSPYKLGTYEHSSLGRLAPSIVRCLPRRAFTWLVLLDWFQPFRPVFLAVLFSFFLHLPQIIFLHALPPFTFAIWSFLAYDYLDLTHLFSPPSHILFRLVAIGHPLSCQKGPCYQAPLSPRCIAVVRFTPLIISIVSFEAALLWNDIDRDHRDRPAHSPRPAIVYNQRYLIACLSRS